MLVEFHVHSRSAKSDALHTQAESLLGGGFAGAVDGSTGADDAMPRQSRDLPQDADNLPGGSRPAGGPGDGSVSRDSSLWQSADGARDAGTLIRGLGVGFGLAWFLHKDSMYKRL